MDEVINTKDINERKMLQEGLEVKDERRIQDICESPFALVLHIVSVK